MPPAGIDVARQLLARGEWFAFHGRPADGVGPLTEAVKACARPGEEDLGRHATWLLGVCLAASGRYWSGMRQLRPLVGSAEAPGNGRFAGLAATTMASIQRQLGRHVDARRFDDWALRVAGSDPIVVVDSWMGLAADAVGDRDIARAGHALDQAVRACNAPVDWRTSVRLDWVRAEIALATGDPAAGVGVAASALEVAEVSGAPRHVAKSLLFLAAARTALAARNVGGQEDLAVSDLRRSVALASSLGALPLVWPACLMLARARSVPEEIRRREMARARTALQTIIDDLPAQVAREWMSEAEVAEVLAS